MAGRKSPIDHLLDVFVFAPAGFVANIQSYVPDMAARGREQFDAQLRLVRLVGDLARRSLRGDTGRRTPPMVVDATSRPYVASSVAEEEVIPVRHEDDDPVIAASVGEDELAIPGYDSLAASQVVTRLDGLDPPELEAVRRYEAAHRGRKTVLGKIAQLQAG